MIVRKLITAKTVAVATIAVVAATAALLATRSPARPSQPEPPAKPVRAAAPATSGAAGDLHNLPGARAAALRYLALSEIVLNMSEEAAVDAQRDAASTAAAEGLVADLRRKLASVRQAFPAGPVWYRVGPLTARVVGAGPDQARAEIWHVGVVSPPNVAPYEEWRMARYDLVWERGGWRVTAESSGPGPRPTAPTRPEPVSADALEAALTGFTSTTGAP